MIFFLARWKMDQKVPRDQIDSTIKRMALKAEKELENAELGEFAMKYWERKQKLKDAKKIIDAEFEALKDDFENERI